MLCSFNNFVLSDPPFLNILILDFIEYQNLARLSSLTKHIGINQFVASRLIFNNCRIVIILAWIAFAHHGNSVHSKGFPCTNLIQAPDLFY